jgi:hypothetical protein
MNLNEFMKAYAEEIDGSYSEYDDERSVIIVPLKDDRFQTVIAEILPNEHLINISSKVCSSDDNVNIRELLQENHEIPFCKFALSKEFLNVEANFNTDNIDQALLKKVILDVAHLADKWEFKITGKDIF